MFRSMCIHKVLSKSAKIRTFAKTRNNLHLCECDIRHGGGVARMRCWIRRGSKPPSCLRRRDESLLHYHITSKSHIFNQIDFIK